MADIVTYPSPTELHFSRWIAAPVGVVWRVHTEWEHLQHWWGPEGFRLTSYEMDVRSGGHWKFMMHGPGPGGAATDYPNLIAYEAVEPEHTLAWSHGTFDTVHFHVKTTFTPERDGTRIDTTMRFPSQAVRDATATYGIPGHESTMGKLEDYLGRMLK